MTELTEATPNKPDIGQPDSQRVFNALARTRSAEGYPLVVSPFNKQRWAHIMSIYSEMARDEAVQNAMRTLAYPYASIVSESNNFAIFTELLPGSWQERTYNLGVRRSMSNISYLAGYPNEKIVKTIKAYEGFEQSNGVRPIEEPTEEYLCGKSETELSQASLFYILTGEYARDRETKESNPNYEEFIRKESPIAEDQLQRIYQLYQTGIRMGILHAIANNLHTQ